PQSADPRPIGPGVRAGSAAGCPWPLSSSQIGVDQLVRTITAVEITSSVREPHGTPRRRARATVRPPTGSPRCTYRKRVTRACVSPLRVSAPTGGPHLVDQLRPDPDRRRPGRRERYGNDATTSPLEPK